MRTVKFLALGALGVFSTNCVKKAETAAAPKVNWTETANDRNVIPDNNDPKFILPTSVREFSALPLEGSVAPDHIPWSESYFANMLGGLARRWQDPAQKPWTYVSPTKEQLKTMSSQDIRKLSPAEKLDIYRGQYDYPFLKVERERVKPDAAGWEGLCNGWSAVSLALPEPQAVNIENADGIVIPFGSSDIKGLYMLNQTMSVSRSKSDSKFVGSRCYVSRFDKEPYAKDPNCQDVNAGAFHLVITNMIGMQKKGFIAELEADKEIWNHPVWGYKSKVVDRTGNKIKIETTIDYTTEAGNNFHRVIGTPSMRLKQRTYLYTVDLNSQGQIVGGDWIKRDSDEFLNQPDFLWTESLSALEPEFKGLDEIYKESLRNRIEPPDIR